jgi:hypothetical protein
MSTESYLIIDYFGKVLVNQLDKNPITYSKNRKNINFNIIQILRLILTI